MFWKTMILKDNAKQAMHFNWVAYTGKWEEKKKLNFKIVLLNSKVYSVSTAVCASYMVSEMLAKLIELLNEREIITILKLIYSN
jgi:hypothetical protein